MFKRLRRVRNLHDITWFVLSRLVPALGIDDFVHFRYRNFRIAFRKSILAKMIWRDRTRYTDDLHFLVKILRNGDVVYDVGANIGIYSFAAAHAVGSAGYVYAFEPHPSTFANLTANMRLNRIHNMAAAQVAVSDAFGWAGLTAGPQDVRNHMTDDGATLHVPTIRLDHFMPHERITLVKIDVEGAEKAVLDGMRSAFNRVENIYFEVSDRLLERFGKTFTEIHQFLTEQGFEILEYHNGGLRIVPSSDTFPKVRNLLASRDRERLERIFGSIQTAAA